MRRKRKQELYEITVTLREAVEELKDLCEKEETEEKISLLTQMQETAVRIGDVIETAEGKGTACVRHLEEYCEMIYQCAIEPDRKESRRICKTLAAMTEDISQSIRHELPEDKLQVVFLPYKASMWDSLESVWFAARDDETCDAYVIPIPYYDKNPNGSFAQMHYEGDRFPEYVPITDWKSYDLKKEQPDIIYFHNPYDKYNRVTSVHPVFYSLELEKCTDLLVYIPYFICEGDVPEHFCNLPGVFYADKVIVQSEEVRRTYMNEYLKIFGQPENKFLALGSPKIDKVINTTRNDKNLPEEWKKLIYYTDNDGVKCRRKVILYNTSVQMTLLRKEVSIQKMQYVLRLFKEKENIILWWRPHPLLLQTIESMLPELAAAYKKAAEDYKREGWGIFDDTEDMNRAIAESDAYYGDGGSMVALYKVTGKPIMIQNMDIMEETE